MRRETNFRDAKGLDMKRQEELVAKPSTACVDAFRRFRDISTAP